MDHLRLYDLFIELTAILTRTYPEIASHRVLSYRSSDHYYGSRSKTQSIAPTLAGTQAGAADFADAIRAVSDTVQRTCTFHHENPELGKHETKAQAHLNAALLSLGFTEFVESSSAPTAAIAVLDSASRTRRRASRRD